jgi:hypothetical protein
VRFHSIKLKEVYMSCVILGENRYSLIDARRQDDLAFGLLRKEERPGISASVFMQNGWRLIYDEPKKYHRLDDVTRVRVWFSSDETLVMKLDDPGMLIDQASALIRLKKTFGVKVPDHLLLVADGAISLLQMEKLDFWSGYKIHRIVRGDDQPLAGMVATATDLKELYRQAKQVAMACKAYIMNRPYDVTGFHHGNWGVTTEAFTNWAPGKTLAAKDVVIFDPVSMQYDKQSKA